MPPIPLPSLSREQLIAKWAKLVDSVQHISVWTAKDELAWLAELASNCQIMAEVGSYKGKSAKVLAGSCKGLVVCVDCFVDGTEPVFRSHLKNEIETGKVKLLSKTSIEGAADVWKMQNGTFISLKLFDAIFIDAGHAEADVDQDIDAWLPLLRPGGILCGHDFEKDDPNSGVAKSVRKKLPDFVLAMNTIWAWRKP